MCVCGIVANLDNFVCQQLVPSTLHFRRGHVVDNCLALIARGPHGFELGFLQVGVQAIAPWNRKIGSGLWTSFLRGDISMKAYIGSEIYNQKSMTLDSRQVLTRNSTRKMLLAWPYSVWPLGVLEVDVAFFDLVGLAVLTTLDFLGGFFSALRFFLATADPCSSISLGKGRLSFRGPNGFWNKIPGHMQKLCLEMLGKSF